MARQNRRTPYHLDEEPILQNYEIIREVWFTGVPIQAVCQKYKLARSHYYEIENRFVEYGVAGLFPEIKAAAIFPELERLILLVSEARPSLSQQAMLRMAEALPLTRQAANPYWISQILASYGRSPSDLPADQTFWDRIQRTLNQLGQLKTRPPRGRNRKQRKKTFFQDNDSGQKRMELLRELFYTPSLGIKEVCLRYGIAPTSYYRLVAEYHQFGPWAVISAYLPGKESLNGETELTILLEKLRHPHWSAAQIVQALQLRCSRFAVHRIFSRWNLTDKNRPPVALDQYCPAELSAGGQAFQERTSAFHLHSEASLLESRRINRHFELICNKMKTHAYHLCDPGPLLLAPFVNDLGIVQAMESFGPPRLRGQELTNLALLNVFRIVGGYRRINHLSDNRDRSVAFASGLGLFGTRSRYYQDTLEFKFDQLHSLRCDLVTRAKELGIIEGIKIALDFHFKRFFGEHSQEKGVGKGPDKSGDLVPGFRPHVAWDLATNTILSMCYYHGGKRAPGIVEQYCEQHIFPLIDPQAIREIYMDSEYTKERSLEFFKTVRCPNGEVYLCLKKNRQIKKLIKPALESGEGWKKWDTEDEIQTIQVILPKTQLPLQIAILRDLQTRQNIRCFGSTNLRLSSEDLLKKYRYRWLIENGLKDLVYSYFLDEMYGSDPEKIEFDFYCVMIARLSYEYFLKELGGEHFYREDGNKTTLQTMRCLLFEKRNFTLELDANENFILTLLDTNGNELERRVAKMLEERMAKGLNKVLWWGNRGILLRFEDQYQSLKVSGL